jgi:hypothetical protein
LGVWTLVNVNQCVTDCMLWRVTKVCSAGHDADVTYRTHSRTRRAVCGRTERIIAPLGHTMPAHHTTGPPMCVVSTQQQPPPLQAHATGSTRVTRRHARCSLQRLASADCTQHSSGSDADAAGRCERQPGRTAGVRVPAAGRAAAERPAAPAARGTARQHWRRVAAGRLL